MLITNDNSSCHDKGLDLPLFRFNFLMELSLRIKKIYFIFTQTKLYNTKKFYKNKNNIF